MAKPITLKTDSHLARFTDGELTMWRKYLDKYLIDSTDDITDAARKAFEYGFHAGRGYTETVLREADLLK